MKTIASTPPHAKAKSKAVAKPVPSQPKTAVGEKIDLGKLFAAEYVAPRQPTLVHTKPARYLVVAGTGGPGTAVFQARIGALYSIAFTVKMTRRFSGQQDYTVGKLEARYLNLDGCPKPPPNEWQWQLLIRTPEFVTAEELAGAVAALRKRGKEGDAALVELATIDEGQCVQMLHVGPYDREGETIEAMQAFAAERGLALRGPHHEIYISDPRRVEPAKLKTIIRLAVKPV